MLKARSPRFFNLMWPLLGQRRGTHYFDNFASLLDQFLVSRPLLERTAPIRVDLESVRIEAFPEMVGRGDYPAPRRFGRPSSGLDRTGFSDHFPISVVLHEAEAGESRRGTRQRGAGTRRITRPSCTADSAQRSREADRTSRAAQAAHAELAHSSSVKTSSRFFATFGIKTITSARTASPSRAALIGRVQEGVRIAARQ